MFALSLNFITVVAVAASVPAQPTFAAKQTAAAQASAPVDLDFRDVHERPVGARGLRLSEALRRADGQTVRLFGYVVQQEEPDSDRFFFSPVPLALSEHADGEADDLPASTVLVLLPQADTTRPPAGRRIGLVGTLQVGRLEAADGRVSWVRLRLPVPNAGSPPATDRNSKQGTAP